MSAHVPLEQIVEYLDGTLPVALERVVAAHLDACANCTSRLAELAEFDGFVQSHQPGDDLVTAAMFQVSERMLARPRPRRTQGSLLALVAALLLVASGAFWAFGDGGTQGLGLRITRYVPEGALRSAPPERFHLDLDLTEAGFVAAFARFGDGRVVQLWPTGAPELSPRGALRVPANELLDWEYPADGMPTQVLVVAFAAEPAADVLAELRQAWAGLPPDEVPAAANVAGRRAQLLAFPAR